MNTIAGIRNGRSPSDGHFRGCGLDSGALRQEVLADPRYREALACAEGRTVVTQDRLMNLFLLLTRYLSQLDPGDIIEFGSYRAGSAFFMGKLAQEFLPGTQVFALDTFSGLPEVDPTIDAHGAGDFKVDFQEITRMKDRLGLSNVHLIKGMFQDTAPGLLARNRPFRLAHIDCDLYSSVIYSYDVSKSRMVKGGYIVFDDATAPSCLGATEAVESVVIQRDGLFSEQIWPHHVFRAGL